ncbi:non-ribosomal peptide synthase/polyketide synthase [Longimicrobium sp.]|uniref:non-ribosomal peptide synthetase n=1 Tax=Longimicrobium sp. TaxID=2029185 RepID=UPI003B3BE9EC
MNPTATLNQLTPAQRLELMKMARARKLVGEGSELPPIERAAREGPLPLSFAQERLWFIDRLEPGSAVYNLPVVAWRPAGELDQAALERALGEIVRRHDALRTVFAEVDGSPVQVVAPFSGFSLPVEDLSGLGQAEREAAFRRREGEEARRTFDLSAGPLFRAVLLSLGADEHVLLLSMHHIVSDGWSLGVLQRELGALYAAYRDGRDSPLPELPVQYADYAVWQREHLAGVLNRQLAYWRERLAGAPELLELPADHPRPPVQTYRGVSIPVQLSPELLERLEALGRGEGATLYMTLLGAFQVLLSRYSGGEDIVVGSPIAGRTRGEVEGLIGFFVNTLVLRTDLSGDPSFREILRRVREATLGAYAHQELPFEKLVAELQPERSLSHSPLFQVMFTLQNAGVGGGGGAPAGLETNGAGPAMEVAKFDLSLELVATPRGLRGALNYSTDLFERGTIERMLGHLERVLEQVADDADVRLSQLELLGDAERALVLEAWNRTEAEVPAALCIHELFEVQAARTPDAVAVRFEDASLTYAELNARANQLAHHLRGLGVGPEVRVGVLMERSLEMVVSLLAVLKAGGAYVPLDPGLPAERLAYMLVDADVAVLLTQERLRGILPASELPALEVDAAWDSIARESAENPAPVVTPSNVAYVIYTSGSTGRPKGVMNQHRGVVNRLVWMQAHFGLSADDVVLQKTPFSFDVSVWEFFWPLQQGATLVMARPDGHRDPLYLQEIIEAEGVTTLHFVPSMLQSFVEAVEPGRCASLRHVVCSGEALPPALVHRFYDRFAAPVVLTNLYGPTEAAVDVSCWTCAREEAADVVPIGRPVWNTQLYVLDAALKPAPVGVPGELYIGGVQVARGYQGRAAMTAERFVPDPFSAEPGARLYRTGDRARWRADGAIEYLGRLDFQVKVRGFRIELGEIEARLAEHADVREAVVIARADAGEQRLVAYVVGGVETDALRAHLRRSLPEYMVPAAFVRLDALPLTANGKLARKALPVPEFAAGADRYVAPRTPAEEVLAGIWAEVLRLERVGVEESFFQLGGHSLLATRVVSRVRDAFGVELPLRALFEAPTVAELSRRVEEMRRAGAPGLPPVVPIERTGALPLSFAQERLWFIDRLEPGSTVYNVPVARRLGGALDVVALERALGEVVRRHESLRTVFAETDGAPVQVVAPFSGFALPVEDLSGLGEAAVERRTSEEARRVFDLAAGPLFRAALLRVDAEDHVLLLSMHHIVSDGWSMGLLFREVAALYAAYREGGESPLAELPVQYADYAVWQREQLAGEALERQLSFWRERLAGAPELLELPTDHPRPPVQTFRGASVPLELSPELLERLQALGRGEGATLFMTLLGAFQVLLGKYAGSDDIVVGTTIAGRTRGEVEALIGFFVNTLVLRTDLGGDPSFRAVLRRVREATLGAYEHQEVPFERVVAELQPERSLSHSPLFQVVFELQEAGGGGGALQGLKVGGAGSAMEVAQFDLSLTLAATSQGLRGVLNYSTDLFDRDTAERMLSHFARVLEQVAADADVRLSRLALAGPRERARVVVEWNRTQRPFPRACIHQLFQEQAARTPGAAALVWGAEELTYRELDARSNRLAHHLAGLGVGPESRVGVRVERSVANVVATLAVLKAGGCCVPVDTSYPAERMALMLADSAVRVLLTDGELAAPGLHVIRLDQAEELLAAHPDHPLSTGVSAGNLAYVFYTSGSTGRPKGVMMGHREVVQYAACLPETMPIGPGDRVAQASNASFDAAVFEIWGALVHGATLVGIDRDVLLSAPLLGQALREQGITHLYQTAALFNQHVRGQVDVYAGLRQLVFGAEAVGTEGVRAMLREGKPARVLHEYGPTEATVWCTLEEVDEVEEGAATVSIGRPIPNARAYVLDPAGQPLPVGVPGELCIGGDGVVRGYLGRPGLTAERFVPDPFAAEPGARMYRTGDRARWKADGKLEFMGRLDDQVKIRGFRIEPGEVEAAIAAYPGVRQARVMMRQDQPGDKQLVAYIVGDAEAEALRAHLRQSLPEYMVPAAFVVLPQLPLTPNGKLDRKALPAPEGDAYARRSYEAPLGEIETALAGIWAEVLGLDRVGRRDNFFELGGHSLLAIRLIEGMRRAGLYVEVRALFTTPVLAELALAVGGASSEVKVPANAIPEGSQSITPPMLPLVELSQAEIDRIVADVPGGAAQVQDIYPLAPLQEGILFHHLLSQDGDPYLLSYLTVFDGRAPLDAYLAALQAVIDRHDVLRTAVAWEGLREPVQVVWRHAPLPVDEVELDAGAEAEDAPRQLWERYDPRRFRMDLGQAPLMRACIAEDRVRGRWLLLLLWHHLAEDHESLEVMQEEIAAHLQGRESELPAPLPFRNYVAQARLGVSREEHERFFRGMLGDIDEPTAPFGLLDVWGEGRGVAEAWLPVAGDLGARLRGRARALGVSVASLCHLAWAQVLARVSGRSDVVFGTLLFGRMQGGEGTDRVMGPFINTLPVRIGVGEEGAEAAVRRTHALLADLLRHEHASLSLAQRSSGVAAPAPLFTSLLNYRHGGAPRRPQEAGQPGEGGRTLRVQERTNYPVAVAVNDLGDELSLVAQVAAPADAERVCRMMHTALERLVEALEDAPGRAIGAIDVLPEAERRVVVEAWNRTDADYPADATIHRLFEEQAARTPDAAAVVFEDDALSYAELNARANRLANYLRRRGVRPETRVGICLERGPELVVAILAVLKAGGAYVPLDPSYPAERLAFMLADSGAPLLLTRLPLPDGLSPHTAEVVCLDADRARIEAESAEAPAVGVSPDHLAYVIYTSGSTGTPKGVMVPHRGVPNLAHAQARRFGIDGSSRLLQFASFSFDAAVAEVFDALLNGAALVMASRDALLPGAGLLETLRRGRVTVATLPPSVLAILPPDGLPELRTVVSAGEAVDAATVERWSAGRTFVNAYGPTEVTVCATAASVEADGRAPAIGRPLENVRVYVLDAAGRPAPVDVAGELYVGGVGVARGYLGRPGLTAERFVPDPFGGEPGARLYRTGDRVRWSAQGELEFLGRVDEQVKVRGFRIEPGEIEGALRRSEGVADCAVVARQDVPGETRLVAYVVGDAEAGALREHLRRSLPEHMVPSAFVSLDALPLTPNGKLDRKALPAPDLASAGERYVAPRTPVEEVLAEIWAEVLRLERVGVTESFFELGGHSLLATRVVSRVREVFGVELPLRALFERPTVGELAGRVEEMRRAGAPVLPSVVPAGRAGALPLSFAQERLWFLDRLEPGSTTYNMPAAWRLGGALDPAALERALGEIVRRHEALRTVFAEADGSPVQVIAPFDGFALPVEDLSGLGDADREAAARRRAGEEAARPFDLAAGPLFRAALLRLGGEDYVLLLSMHHIVSDGWSMGVLFREMSALYEAYREGRASPLPELAVQYADYAVWQREQLAGETLDGQLAYWKERLADAPALLELPSDHPRPAVQSYRGATVPVQLSPELLERLQALSRTEGATLYMTLLGAFQVLLSRYSGSEDVVVGSPIAGRTRGEVEALIGFFINTLVLRTDLSGDPSFRETLRRVREATLGAYAHQELPFEKLVVELQPERSLSHSPLFQVMFTLQNAGGGGGALAGLKVGGVGAAMQVARFDLSLELTATPEGLRGGIIYSTDLFERGTIVRMLGHLERVLEQVAGDADVRLSELELLGETERARVVDEWNRTEAEVPADRCIHQLFEAQAARTPDAVAVRFEDASLTYAQLNARANQLAHHLRGRGVGAEVRVGVLMERSFEMVISLLAVLKAGGGYVPLDPGLPAERLAYMLEDSSVPLVLVQAAQRETVPAREGVEVLVVDALAERLAAEPAENPAVGAGPDSLAYVIYTSGSTGRPKGVMNQHRGVVNRLVWMQAHFGIGADDVVLQKTPFSFDVSVWEFFWPLQQGARLVMARPDGHRDPLYLQEIIEAEGVTTLHFVPSMLQSFVEAVEPTRCASLRNVVCSGEALPPALVHRFYDRFAGPVVLTNLYGPTEATVDVSCWMCARDEAADVVPIGRPVWNTQLYVLDAVLNPAPVGVPGELYIGGVQVARGYQRRAAMTAERFIPDPFSSQPGARLYRTGDRARWRADGAIEYLGRLDFQVKVRGFRIELGEIEGVLRRSAGVTDCVVLAREDATGDRRLVAYVVGAVEADALREHLRRELPEYMVPAAFVPLNALPLTANGKLDRKALPAPEGDAYARRSYEAPLGEIETALAEIWGEVLGVERVGRWDHFFELGGHSLLGIKLIGRMRQVGLYTDVRALFATPVLADLALAVGRASMEMEIPANAIPEGSRSITPRMLPLVELTQTEIDRIVAEVPGGAANVQDIYPLAPLQEGILFHHLLSEQGDPYLLSMVTEFDTRARLDQHLAALQAVIDRHDILRTAMAWEELREPVQVVLRHAPLPVEEVVLDAGAGDGVGAAERLWRRFDPRHYRMDLKRAPLLRACIAQDPASGRWLLLMLTHHLTNDHESLEVQQEEISAHLLGRGSDLPAPTPFRNYVAQARLGMSRDEHERFFRGMLADVDEPTAPYGLLDVWGEGHGIAEARLAIAGDLGVRLRRRARSLGVTVASLCHLAWAQVLARLSGRNDVVFGTLLFGRMQGGEGSDRVMGPLINTLPVRIGVGDEAVEAAVRRTHALLADLLRHEHASLALAQRSSGVAAPAPLFTSLLNYRHGGGTERSGEAGQPEQGVRGIHAQERTNYPLSLAVDDLGDAFSLMAQVAAPADAEQVCRMMHTALARLVEALETAPSRAIGSIDVLPEAERRVVVEAWNRTEAEYPADRCIHELFEAQAARTPDAVAVEFEGETFRYRELNERANRLAHHLAGLGVGAETRVGICLERGMEMIVAALAVLKAGGGYVPLDPAYPAERLAFMLADAAVPVLVTQESLRAVLPTGEGVAVVSVDGDAARLAAESAENPERPVSPDQLAYVIYTSGSTGRPKGVMVPHRGVPNLAYAQARRFGIDGTSRVLQFASFSFDAAVAEVFDTLLNGAALVMAPREALLPGPGLLETLRGGRVTVATLPPSVLAILPPDDLPELRTVISAGEAVDAATVARWSAGRTFVNAYGPTEVTVCATSARCEADGRAPSIGRALENVRVYVLDAAGRPAPVGVPGELYVGGVGVARGYLGRPGLTAERFVPDPFGGEAGARLYRTGDRVRWSAGGELEFLGRVDEQVKVRGFRIEPGEIEGVLRRSEGVTDCVVVACADVPGETRLVAYVVGNVDAGALREHLLRDLPEYMVPSAFVSMDAMPLTPNGKLDRKALPAPGLASASERYVAPRTPVEEVLAEIWAEVLQLERVGVTESFFDLGGHSLLLMRLLAHVQATFDVEISIRTVYAMPALEAMAEEIERRIYEDVATLSEDEIEQLAASNPVVRA